MHPHEHVATIVVAGRAAVIVTSSNTDFYCPLVAANNVDTFSFWRDTTCLIAFVVNANAIGLAKWNL
jgi:hypothetical protein